MDPFVPPKSAEEAEERLDASKDVLSSIQREIRQLERWKKSQGFHGGERKALVLLRKRVAIWLKERQDDGRAREFTEAERDVRRALQEAEKFTDWRPR